MLPYSTVGRVHHTRAILKPILNDLFRNEFMQLAELAYQLYR